MTLLRVTTTYVVVAGDRTAAAQVLGALGPEVAVDEVTVVLLGDDEAPDAPPLAAGRIVVLGGIDLDGPVEAAGGPLATVLGSTAIVLLDSSPAARDLAGWLSVRTGARLAWSVERTALEPDAARVRRIVNGGDDRLVERCPVGDRPLVLLTRATGAPDGSSARSPEPERVELTARPLPGQQREIVTSEPIVAGPRPLAGARIVVSVGRGIGGPERLPLFRALAERLGAGLGATRVVVDAGWLPFAHQVGQTGAAIAPDLYLAFGVSGAVQHLVGMRESRTIVAVNRDRHADLCRIADVVVEGDAVEVAEALLLALDNERKHGE